ncbi:ankyrin repeat-containing domain protein [Xylaria curta]|nr:ankyrin repeat-containing domain protein [Xylaria curta]
MAANTSFGNYGPGPQNTAAGCGPQSNMNGAGTQNNYYGHFQDLQTLETEKLRIEKEDCLRSLSFPNMNTRRQNIDDSLPGTCDWLFSTVVFDKWRCRSNLSSHNGVLWIKGKPGTGKSTLMSHTLSFCEDAFSGHRIAAYFFNARGVVLEKTPLGMMRSIVYQLLKKDDTIYGVFLDLYREKRMIYSDRELQWEQSELKKFIQSIVKKAHLELKPLLFLVDALDECDEKDVRGVVDFLQTLSVNAVNAGVELRICLSSRHYPQISMKKNLELIVERRREHMKDIDKYIEEKLYAENEDIMNQLRNKANGIFLWIAIVVAMLNKAYDEGRDEAMQKTLDEVPEDLEGIFEALLESGSSDKVELTSMLQWVLFSQRPLTPQELYFVVVSESLPSEEAIRRRIVSSSKGLIEVRKMKMREDQMVDLDLNKEIKTDDKMATDDEVNMIEDLTIDKELEFVQFIHVSVNNFLCRNKRLETLNTTLEPDAISASHACIWAYCWSCIKSLDTPTDEKHAARLRSSHHFLGYATTYIFDHADEALSNAIIGRRLDNDVTQWLIAQDHWLGWLSLTRTFDVSHKLYSITHTVEVAHTSVLCVLALAPYRNLIRFVLDHGVDINAQGGFHGDALQVACFTFKDYDIINLLLENGANINAQGGFYGNALQVCSRRNNYNVVKLLLNNGANVNAQGGFFGSALQAACYAGNSFDVVKLLLENGANVNAQGGYYDNALQAACHARNNLDVVKLLLDTGADVNAQGGHYGNALQVASCGGKYNVVKLLLENGANVNAQGGYHGNALQAAKSVKYIAPDDRDIVEILLENGAEGEL